MERPITNTKVTLIGHPEKKGILTGLTKPGKRCEYWQCYWTENPTGSDNINQWVPADQIIRL